jgi:hypothetical protein
MTKRLRSTTRFFGGLVLLAALAVGFAAGLRALLHYLFRGVSPTVAAAIVAAVATGLLSLLTLVVQRQHERQESIEQEIRARKIAVYTALVDRWFDIFGLGEERSEEESAAAISAATARLAKMTPELISWASDEVLATWSRYRRAMTRRKPDPVWLMFGFEDVLLTIRRDVGHANAGLTRGDLLALWINDVDEALMPALADPNAQVAGDADTGSR